MLSDKVTYRGQYRFVLFYENYFLDFYKQLNDDAQLKCEFVFHMIQTVERIPSKFFKQITGIKGLYEVRIEYESKQIRIFSFFDDVNKVIVLNGFYKKSQRTPRKELSKAKLLRRKYYEEKKT